MVLGILGLALCGIFAPFAWSTGGKAVKEIDANPAGYSGRGEPSAGKIMGIVGTCISPADRAALGLSAATAVDTTTQAKPALGGSGCARVSPMSDEQPGNPSDPSHRPGPQPPPGYQYPPPPPGSPPPNWGSAYPPPPHRPDTAIPPFIPPPPQQPGRRPPWCSASSASPASACFVPILVAPVAWILGAKAVEEIDAQSRGVLRARRGQRRQGHGHRRHLSSWSSRSWWSRRSSSVLHTTGSGDDSYDDPSYSDIFSAGPGRSELAADEHRLVDQRDAVRLRTPSRTSRARASSSAVVAPPRLVSARTCLVDRPTGPRLALAKAGVVDEPGGTGLDRAVRPREPGRIDRQRRRPGPGSATGW